MMFRGKEEDEESASDWDDLTPKSSPHLRTGAGNRSTGSPHSRGPSPSPTITHPPSTLLVQKEADSHESAIPKRMVLRKADTLVCNAPLTSIAGVKTPQPPPIKTPPNAKPVYLLNSEEGTRQILKEMSPGVSGGTDRMDEGVQKNEEERMVFNEDPPGNEEKKFMSMEEGYREEMEYTTVSGVTADYLVPTHQRPHAYMTQVASECEKYSQRCVEEVFSTLRMLTDFLIAVLLATAQFLLNHILRKLLCGLAHILADSILKPFLTLCFNGCAWPFITLFVQLSKGVVLIFGPLLELFGAVMTWCIHCARACRLVVVSYKTNPKTQTQQV